MSKTNIPLVPVNPREVGPVDLAREFGRVAGEWLDENTRELIGGTVAIVVVVILAHAFTPWDFTWPHPPNILFIGFALTVTFGPAGWFYGSKTAEGLRYNETVLISQQDPITGDQRLVHLQPDTFREMRVFTHNGKERDRSFLHSVVINGRRGFEVDVYHEGANAAVASWQAGVSNSQLRQDRKRIKKVKTKMEKEVDKALEVITNHVENVRTGVQEVSMQLIAQTEEVELPGEHSLHERLSDRMDDVDMSSMLGGIPDDSDGLDVIEQIDAMDVEDDAGSGDDGQDSESVEVEITDGGEDS